ncbi:hypothetical protein ABIE13_003736 [Ottowia thiooxydans]|uniref:Uncharacterized protein n=1 Tax=Ottowia thiooxydans TaxID=219182 RepID=A0ABV2QC78_9BURK
MAPNQCSSPRLFPLGAPSSSLAFQRWQCPRIAKLELGAPRKYHLRPTRASTKLEFLPNKPALAPAVPPGSAKLQLGIYSVSSAPELPSWSLALPGNTICVQLAHRRSWSSAQANRPWIRLSPPGSAKLQLGICSVSSAPELPSWSLALPGNNTCVQLAHRRSLSSAQASRPWIRLPPPGSAKLQLGIAALAVPPNCQAGAWRSQEIPPASNSRIDEAGVPPKQTGPGSGCPPPWERQAPAWHLQR